MTNIVWVYYSNTSNNYSPNDLVKIFEIWYSYTYTGFQTLESVFQTQKSVWLQNSNFLILPPLLSFFLISIPKFEN